MVHPIHLLSLWLEEEKVAGANYAQHAVLSTVDISGKPRARVVAIRDIQEDKIIFFTQKRTQKVTEINACSAVALTFWFERFQREVIIEGEAGLLSIEDNKRYWDTYPKWAQLRFCSYAPSSGLAIDNKQILQNIQLQLEQKYSNNPVPFSTDYCGVFVKPRRFVLYAYRLDELSDVWEYELHGCNWLKRRLSP
ncbi:pyridoxamine 5'-phosphate oxidase family protein [Legionella septentrionalis]|uniref:pyridoxamine 5'-phosphate oxidase family protein n=1 Tax=Legionella septentrionalis TaxID=2498109 RepID=UPI000F8C7DFE|nr:pyridoxamine 5'-phosphate oxidase family protein [Legionella septentrionalis]RUQ94647.1 pyridoxamine 5'-phosphate oxidase [Legionella septentrionalis]